MATATKVASDNDGVNVYASYRVPEGGATGDVEYNVSTPILDSDGVTKSDSAIADDLKAALVAARAANVATPGPTVTVPATITL